MTNVLELFQSLETPPADQIFALTARYKKAVEAHKVGQVSKEPITLGVGKFINKDGRTPVLSSVSSAIQKTLSDRLSDAVTGGYQPIPGGPEFRACIEKLVLGEELSAKFKNSGVLTSAQTLGGTGANFLQGHLLHTLGIKRIALSDPTWGNHKKIFPFTGLELGSYPYYSFSDSKLLFGEMCEALKTLTPETAVSFHACCHNPTGEDLSPAEWDEVLAIVKERGLVAVFDSAYAGFGSSFDEDLYGVRKSITLEIPTLVAFSFSKIASLYEERVGGIIVALPEGYTTQEAIEGNLNTFQRTSVSNPPALFARAITKVLRDSEFAALWQEELGAMASEIREGGALLAKELDALGVKHGGIQERKGMFAILPFTPEQVKRLEKEEQIYMLANGRINVAAVKERNAAEIAKRIARVVG